MKFSTINGVFRNEAAVLNAIAPLKRSVGVPASDMPLTREKIKKENDTMDTTAGRSGKYRKKEPLSPSVAGYYHTSSVVRHPTAPRRSDQTQLAGNKSTRSISVPSLHGIETKARYSPPPSPPKPRSKSVRLNTTKKVLSFRRLKKLFGSHSELDNGCGSWTTDQQNVGTYRPLNYTRPRSIGGSSDCSSSSYTDFSRCNSLRDSSHSRISHGNDSVFGMRQASYDSTDYVLVNHHMATGSTDSNSRPYSIACIPRSSSSTSLKSYGIQSKDPRYFSVAAIPVNSTSVDPQMDSLQSRKQPHLRLVHRPQDDTESVWEESHSFTFVPNAPVVPSDPGYRQVAEELMSALPTRKNSIDFQIDPRRISDASVDPRRVSNDSGVESSSTKPNRSLPSTPIAQSFSSVRNGGASTPELRLGTPHDYLSQESLHSLPSGWDIAYTPQGLRYYLDHKTQTTHWRMPDDAEDTLGLPSGWEVVRSSRYGTYYVNHNNKTAIYQHPSHARPPPPYHRPLRARFEEEEPKQARERRTPARSHSHSTQTHRVLDPNASLPRRSKSFRDQEMQDGHPGSVSHERQLSTMTYVPPSPYQITEIPPWLREYVDAPFGHKRDTEIQWHRYSYEDLTGIDTMTKRLLKKGSEMIVKQYEYYRVAVQQELDTRIRQNRAAMQRATQQQLSHEHRPPPLLPPPYPNHKLAAYGGPHGSFFEEPRTGKLQPRLSDSNFQGLEETFV